MKSKKYLVGGASVASSVVGIGSLAGAIVHTDLGAGLTLTYSESNSTGTEIYIDFEGQVAAIQTSAIPNDDVFIADYSSDDFTFETPESSIARAGSNLLEFALGAEIGSGSNFGAYGDVRDGSTFDNSRDQYAGVRLDTGNYGWVEISFDSVANILTVYQFAYEDSGASILAGDGAVPEPSTAMSLLLAGSAMAMRRRRRKQIQ